MNRQHGGLPVDWLKGRWGTNTTVFTYPILGHASDKAARIDMTEHTSGDAKWYFAHVPTTPGVTYDFSNWYRSNVSTYLTAQYQKTDGTYLYQDLALLPPVTDWTQTSVQFTPPSGTISTTIFHLINQVGWLETDTFFLAEN